MASREHHLPRSLGWRLSRHAREACVARGVPLRDVLLTVVDYEQSYSCENYGEGRQIRQRGQLAVVVEQHGRVIITVLLRQQEEWTDDDVRTRMRGAA